MGSLKLLMVGNNAMAAGRFRGPMIFRCLVLRAVSQNNTTLLAPPTVLSSPVVVKHTRRGGEKKIPDLVSRQAAGECGGRGGSSVGVQPRRTSNSSDRAKADKRDDD